jgi:hypothetical protein
MKEFMLHIDQRLITNTKAVRKAFEELEDGHYLVRIEPKKKRSLNQNAYFHGIMVPMVLQGLREAGYSEVKTPEDAKDIIKSLFLKKMVKSELTGEEIPVIRHTSELTTVEFNLMMEECGQWASEYLGLFIPPPNYQSTMQL